MLKELHIPVDERGVEIDKLSGFIELYEKLDMPTNSLFLKNELYKIAGKTIYSDPKRNFFAHAGLSEGLIQIQPHEDKYYVKYIPERKSEIRSWLKYPTI